MFAITNIAKPITAFINTAKVSFAELWSTIPTTWATETRTWAQCATLFSNTSKPTTTITNIAKPS